MSTIDRTRLLTLSAVFVALLSVGAFVQIPTFPVPVTLQFAFCLLAGLLLGKRSILPVAVYLALGLFGLPVFSAGGGLAYALKPTFGYLLGFVVATPVVGAIAGNSSSFKRNILACLVGVLCTYAVALPYLYFMTNLYLGVDLSIGKALLGGCAIFLPTDLLWCALASVLGTKLAPRLALSKKDYKHTNTASITLDTKSQMSDSISA